MFRLTPFILSLILSSFAMAQEADLEEVKIIGGRNATAEERPWVVKIHFKGKGLCTGSLISPLWVITAAHCFVGSGTNWANYQILGGGDGTLAKLETLPAVKIVHIHPGYTDFHTSGHDMALIRLAEKITVTPALRPIPLKRFPKTGTPEVSITGWGLTSAAGALPMQLQTMALPAVRTAELGTENLPVFLQARPWYLEPGILMVNGPTMTTCGGDSGAGWTMLFNGQSHLIGIHSAGDFCKSTALSAELSPSIPWIRLHLLLGI